MVEEVLSSVCSMLNIPIPKTIHSLFARLKQKTTLKTWREFFAVMSLNRKSMPCSPCCGVAKEWEFFSMVTMIFFVKPSDSQEHEAFTHVCGVWQQKKIQEGPKHFVPAQPRTIKSFKNDFQCFEVHGSGKESKAKAFNNVCSQPLWNTSLSQVCPPYLHILLGVTQKHRHLLESFCHELDLNIAKDLEKKDFEADKTTKFSNYVSQL